MSEAAQDLLVRCELFGKLSDFFKKVQPNIAHLVTIKPVLYGGIATRLTGVPGVVAAISGLGFVFSNKGKNSAVIRVLVVGLYRLALGKQNLKVICQNPDDRETLMQAAGLKKDKVTMIPGSGVDISIYKDEPLPQGR